MNKLSEVLNCDIEEVIEETNRMKPILGTVKAGYDLWVDECLERYIELGKVAPKKETTF